MLSSEARTAYREWRGDACEEDSCRVEDLDSACDAAICSLGSATTFGDWFEMGPIAKSQSLVLRQVTHPPFLPTAEHCLKSARPGTSTPTRESTWNFKLGAPCYMQAVPFGGPFLHPVSMLLQAPTRK